MTGSVVSYGTGTAGSVSTGSSGIRSGVTGSVVIYGSGSGIF